MIDTHCHLDHPNFKEDLKNVLIRAEKNGITKIITISTEIKNLSGLFDLCRCYNFIYCTAGTHPCSVEIDANVTIEDLIKFSKNPKLVAFGEVGLDYYHGSSTKKLQTEVFLKYIEAARCSNLPLVIHTRSADADMEQILLSEMKKKAFSFVLHCYSSGKSLARTGINLGGYLSFSGIVTFKSAESIREIALYVPKDRLLIETDAPFLAPVPYRGSRNEPAYIRSTAVYLAEMLNLKPEALETLTTENALRIFPKLTL